MDTQLLANRPGTLVERVDRTTPVSFDGRKITIEPIGSLENMVM